jgi:hypothetical protein
VDPAVDAAGHVPDDPGVDGAEEQVTSVCGFACALDGLENPRDLGPREISGQRKPDRLLVAIDAVAAAEVLDDALSARVLPDDRVGHRLAGVAVPDDRRLALVRDAHGGDVDRGQVGTGQGEAHGFAHVVPDLLWVVLDPARPGEDLLVLELPGGDDARTMVEDDRARACRSLVDRQDVLKHRLSPSTWARARVRPT